MASAISPICRFPISDFQFQISQDNRSLTNPQPVRLLPNNRSGKRFSAWHPREFFAWNHQKFGQPPGFPIGERPAWGNFGILVAD
jgi:hypothetical protein